MYSHGFKRFFDFWIALIALICLSPLLIIIMIWLWVDNKGAGVFFLQERPGKNARIFKVLKFKSMTDECDVNGVLLPNEQRITRAGKFIRRTSIDELPQLWNIIKGEMSLIGPRPLPVRYLQLYSDIQAHRHDIRPGLTGWAQVHGRNAISWTKKFEYDIWYVNNLSLWVDLKIIYLTIGKLLAHTDIDASNGNIGGTSFNGEN